MSWYYNGLDDCGIHVWMANVQAVFAEENNS
uniref:Uncharacterized protein n=1 Tax=Anguilla anguilla TaxID=7936 RepID=A0A0E9QU58_ANGAN